MQKVNVKFERMVYFDWTDIILIIIVTHNPLVGNFNILLLYFIYTIIVTPFLSVCNYLYYLITLGRHFSLLTLTLGHNYFSCFLTLVKNKFLSIFDTAYMLYLSKNCHNVTTNTNYKCRTKNKLESKTNSLLLP